MRKFFPLTLIILSCIGYAFADENNETSDVTGHTFYSIRPLYQSAMPEKLSHFRDRALARDCGWGGAFDFTFFGGRTTRTKDLGEFFMFCHKNELAVNSDGDNLLRDVNPLHFNIQYGDLDGPYQGSFSSEIEFRPRQSVFGFGITYKQYLSYNDCCERVWWLEVGLPVYHVRNDMRFKESNIEFEGDLRDGSAANMEEAFKGTTKYPSGDTWEFGKIDGRRKRTRVAEVEVKIGYDYIDCETCHLDSYFGVLIPASRRPKGEFVFEAIPGHNFHGGFLFGGSYGFLAWENCDKHIYVEIDTNSRYLIRNTQTRSFDLKNRPWSRYMLTIKDRDAAEEIAKSSDLEDALKFLTPGINIFTRKVRVHPRFAFNINTSFVYESCGFHAELGYNFWARQGEKVKLKDKWEEGPAIVHLDIDSLNLDIGDSPLNSATIVNRLSNVGNDNIGTTGNPSNNTPPLASCGVPYRDSTDGTDENITIIRQQDLNLQSAAHPCATSHLVFLSAGYHWDECSYPIYAGLGGSYEFSAVNTAVNRWTLWGKFGVSI